MEDIDIRYENGVIYMIHHKTDDTKEFYIGSSFDFKRRCYNHKKDCNNQNSKGYNYKVYKYIRENDGFNEWEIILLYDYPCKNKYELKLEEQRTVKEYKSTLNTQVPARTQKEYRKEYNKNNKEKLAQKDKEYRKNNKEKIAQKNKEYHKNNKEIIAQKKNIYNEANKEKFKMKINCDICNTIVRKRDIARHKKTNYCMNYQKSLV